MKVTKGRKRIFLLIVVVLLLVFILTYQYQAARAGKFDGLAKGENWQIRYALQKESGGEWVIDLNFAGVGSQPSKIQETQVVFADPTGHEVVTRAKGSNENYRFEGHILSNTTKLSESEITDVLTRSYAIVKWENDAGDSIEETIILRK